MGRVVKVEKQVSRVCFSFWLYLPGCGFFYAKHWQIWVTLPKILKRISAWQKGQSVIKWNGMSLLGRWWHLRDSLTPPAPRVSLEYIIDAFVSYLVQRCSKISLHSEENVKWILGFPGKPNALCVFLQVQSIENKLDLLLNLYSHCLKKSSSNFTLSTLLDPDLTSDYHSPTDQRDLFPSANTLNISTSESGNLEWRGAELRLFLFCFLNTSTNPLQYFLWRPEQPGLNLFSQIYCISV